MLKDYYRILGISREARPDEITAAFRKMAMKYHPDRNHGPGAKDAFIDVYEAYQMLTNPDRKAAYDSLVRKPSTSYSSPYETTRGGSNGNEEYERWASEYRKEGDTYSRMHFGDFARRVGGIVGSLALGTVVGLGEGVLSGIAMASAIFGLLLPLLLLIASYALNRYIFALNLLLCVPWYLYSVRTLWPKTRAVDWAHRHPLAAKLANSLPLYLFAVLAFGGYTYLSVHLWFGKLDAERTAREIAFQQSIADLRSHLPQYLHAYPSGKMASKPQFHQKIVVVDMTKRAIYRSFDKIPTSVAAREDKEVREIVQVWDDRKLIGNYTDGTHAYQRLERYAIVDYTTKRTVFRGKVAGSMPPKTKDSGGDRYGTSAFQVLRSKMIEQIQRQRAAEFSSIRH